MQIKADSRLRLFSAPWGTYVYPLRRLMRQADRHGHKVPHVRRYSRGLFGDKGDAFAKASPDTWYRSRRLYTLLLECCADSIGAGGSIARTYRYPSRGAITLALVINAVFHIAANALDMITAAAGSFVMIFHSVTFAFPFEGASLQTYLFSALQPRIVCAGAEKSIRRGYSFFTY